MINIFGLPQTSSATSSQVPNEPEFVESADWLTQLGSSLEISKPFTLPKVMVERFGTYEEAVLTVHKASILDVTFKNGDRYQLRLNRRYLKEWVIRSTEPLPKTMLVVPIDGSLPRPILVTFNTESEGEGTTIGNYFGSGLGNLSLCNDVLYSGELTELVSQENRSNISFSRLEERPTHTSEVVLPLNDFSFETIGPESAFTEGAHNWVWDVTLYGNTITMLRREAPDVTVKGLIPYSVSLVIPEGCFGVSGGFTALGVPALSYISNAKGYCSFVYQNGKVATTQLRDYTNKARILPILPTTGTEEDVRGVVIGDFIQVSTVYERT